jgi:hypothetical protein
MYVLGVLYNGQCTPPLSGTLLLDYSGPERHRVPLFAVQNNRTLHQHVLQCILPGSGIAIKKSTPSNSSSHYSNTV